MLSLHSPAEAAPTMRALTRTGTQLLGGRVADPGVRSMEAAIGRPAAAAVVFPRPRPLSKSQLSKSQLSENQLSENQFGENQPFQEQSSQKYAHTTRIGAAGGGAKGPHPARDPV